jgi:hypothetical protein
MKQNEKCHKFHEKLGIRQSLYHSPGLSMQCLGSRQFVVRTKFFLIQSPTIKQCSVVYHNSKFRSTHKI